MTRLLILGALLSCQFCWAMGIEVSGSVVYMSGDVVEGDCTRFKDAIKNRSINLVIFGDSNGGHAPTGYCVGDAIRANQIATLIDGVCSSACGYMWLGGTSRKLKDASSAFGAHGNYAKRLQGAAVLNDHNVRRLQEYFKRLAPNVDIEMMNRWSTLFSNRNMMYFYNDRAVLCLNGRNDCEVLKGHNISTAGLVTD